MATQVEEVAYLTHIENAKCMFSFNFKLNNESCDHKIKVQWNITDCLESYFKHITNKLNQFIKAKDSSINKDTTIDFKLSLKPLTNNLAEPDFDPSTILLNIINSYDKIQFSILWSNQVFTVYNNGPLVERIKIPNLIFVNAIIQPFDFKTMYFVKNKTKYEWYASSDKDSESWESLGTDFKLKVPRTAQGKFIKLICIPGNKLCTGIPYEVISESVVMQIPEFPSNPFDNRDRYTETAVKGRALRVISYNTLSECYTSKNQFPYCAPSALSIDYRKKLFCKEILAYNGDIICLQELDNRIYIGYLKNKLASAGFAGVYNRKGNVLQEGLGCFYKESKLKFVKSHQIVLCDEVDKNVIFRDVWEKICTYKKVKEVFMKQLTSVQLIQLDVNGTNDTVLIANTHLYYHSEATHIRLLQIDAALIYIENILQKEITKTKRNVSVILCGDFNSMPSSAVYEFVTTGTVTINEEIAKSACNDNFNHSIKFSSTCLPKYTNYTEDFKACLDYIFFQNDKMKCSQFVPFPKPSVLSKDTALPSASFPSDHLAVIADLKFL